MRSWMALSALVYLLFMKETRCVPSQLVTDLIRKGLPSVYQGLWQSSHVDQGCEQVLQGEMDKAFGISNLILFRFQREEELARDC